MPKIVVLGSCRYEPYVVLIMPNKLDPELYDRDQEKAYVEACKKFYPAIDECDIVIVYNPEGVGEHTQRDIEYAEMMKRRITYTHDDVREKTIKDLEEALLHRDEAFIEWYREKYPDRAKKLDELTQMIDRSVMS